MSQFFFYKSIMIVVCSEQTEVTAVGGSSGDCQGQAGDSPGDLLAEAKSAAPVYLVMRSA